MTDGRHPDSTNEADGAAPAESQPQATDPGDVGAEMDALDDPGDVGLWAETDADDDLFWDCSSSLPDEADSDDMAAHSPDDHDQGGVDSESDLDEFFDCVEEFVREASGPESNNNTATGRAWLLDWIQHHVPVWVKDMMGWWRSDSSTRIDEESSETTTMEQWRTWSLLNPEWIAQLSQQWNLLLDRLRHQAPDWDRPEFITDDDDVDAPEQIDTIPSQTDSMIEHEMEPVPVIDDDDAPDDSRGPNLIAVTAGAILLSAVLALILYLFYRKQKHRRYHDHHGSSEFWTATSSRPLPSYEQQEDRDLIDDRPQGSDYSVSITS